MGATVYDDVELADFDFDEAARTFYYPCPCGDRFFITLVRSAATGVPRVWGRTATEASLACLRALLPPALADAAALRPPARSRVAGRAARRGRHRLVSQLFAAHPRGV